MLTLTGANGYSGGTNVTGGRLSISSDGNLGTGGTVALGDGTGIDFTAGGTYSHDITVAGDPTFTVGTGLTVTQSGQIADGATPGDVEVKGGGTLVLSNAGNSFSGGTTVSEDSTLRIGADGALGNSAGGLTLGDATTGGTLALTVTLASARSTTLEAGGGTIDASSGVTGTLSGVFTGAGSLTKTGAGTLILTGANDYTGGTTVSQGTLQGTTDSLKGDIHDNANVTFTQGTTGTYAGVITGNGSLTKTGAGTLILSGANDYTGGTTVSQGTLQGTTVSLQGDIHDNANVTFNQSTNDSYSGALTGSGSLTKSGTGTVTLLGSNNYSGGTIVNGGTLAGTTVTLQGDILDNANVTFDQSSTGTYSDTISGSGSVTKAGSGTVTLLGNNGYQGGTIITGGSLHGTTVSLQGDIHINDSTANVTFDQVANDSYSDNITGSGSLTKAGGGTLTLLGDNGYTGGTTVSGGTLAGTTVSLDGDISVAAGAHVELRPERARHLRRRRSPAAAA